jgi:hypothetical protein
LIHAIVKRALALNDHESRTLRTVCRVLPYSDVVDCLDENFYETSNDRMRVMLVDAVSHVVQEHLPVLAAGEDGYRWTMDGALRAVRFQTTKAAVKRSAEILARYLRSKDELIAFYAAKGLWETDRSVAADRLRLLSASEKPEIVSLVNDLVEEWGID